MTTTGALTRWVTLCCVGCFLGLPGVAWAQEIRWHNDYNKARAVALEKGRPLLIDIGTENCFWCKQLDSRTFRDSAIIGLVNDRFIPLKVNATQSPFLAQALRIQSYPTLVFASPDGKIQGFQEGFIEAGPLKERLLRLLAAVGTPDWMSRDFQEAGKAAAANNYARAIVLYKGIVEDGKDRPVQQRARRALQELERQAADRCARAQKMAETGKLSEAVEAINELARVYPGTRAAQEGRQFQVMLASRAQAGAAQRVRQARELLAQARADYRNQQFLCCLDRCEQLSAQFADLPEGAAGAQISAEIKGNSDWIKKAADQTSERLSVLYLALADSWLKKGQPQQAVFYLERIVQSFPNTRLAAVARSRLAQLQGAPRRGEK
jgi:thioredoxin-like negative regulator of GroEL